MIAIAAAIVVAAAIVWIGRILATELRLARESAAHARTLSLLETFSAGIAAVQDDPRALLTWYPLARTARRLLPEDFARLDASAGAVFPFTQELIQAAHGRWTAEWLAWERAHDGEYKLKAALLEQEASSGAAGAAATLHARLDAIEREKLDAYQRHYQDYVRVAKALQAFQD